MNLASNTAPVSSTRPSRVAAIQTMDWWNFRDWRWPDPMAGIALIPGAVELLGHQPKLNDELAGQVGGLDFAALFLPQPDQGSLVAAHDDAGVRAAYKLGSVGVTRIFVGIGFVCVHGFLTLSCCDNGTCDNSTIICL